MLPEFIASLIKRKKHTSAAPRQATNHDSTSDAALDKLHDPEEINLVTRFWHEAIRFVPLEDQIKSNDSSPELTLFQASQGRLPETMRKSKLATDSDHADNNLLLAVGVCRADWDRLERHTKNATYLLAVPARETASGDFLPIVGENPFFNPSLIQSNNPNTDVFITANEIVNTWMDAHTAPSAQEWAPYWEHAIEFLIGAIFTPKSNLDEALAEFQGNLDVTGKQHWIVKLVYNNGNNSATKSLKAAYEAILNPAVINSPELEIYRRLITGRTGQLAWRGHHANTADCGLLGHIDSRVRTSEGTSEARSREIYPLDPSQRQVVRHACHLNPGDILAVNGPPGTGKTATLRAVIASYWVKSALNSFRPPIIVGCGATNQSVTNITEAFLDAPHENAEYILAQRWNPFVRSYGAFFASDSFAEQNLEKAIKYQAFQSSKDGPKARCLFSIRDGRNPFHPNELQYLSEYYLDKATTYFASRPASLAEVISRLRDLLKTVALDAPNHIRRIASMPDATTTTNSASIQEAHKMLRPLVEQQNSFVEKLFQDWIAYVDSGATGARERIESIAADAECDEADAGRLLTEMLIDCTLRPLAFHVAARYWEGRFIEESAARLYVRSEENLKDALGRLCMLAPCIVSTLNRVPALFQVDRGEPRPYAYGLADLLIMDESGQALPEIAAACFVFAKRALVVGDLQQLEPVPTIQPQNEISILATLQATNKYENLLDTFKSPATGCVLGMAQLASSYNECLGRGLTLRFHYRCVKPIIGYCNRLSYGGRLVAKTGSGENQWPPPLAWVEIAARAARRGGSWVKEFEAKEIATWLRSAWTRLHTESGGKSIDSLVAIISPFKPQIEALKEVVQEAFQSRPEGTPIDVAWPTLKQLNAMTIGTVHSLQGAERPIVLFSGTVSKEDTADPFFNSSRSILNVAASRAKKSFIFFGDPQHLFNTDVQPAVPSGKPSFVLGQHMTEQPLARRLYPLHLVIVEAPGKRKAISEILGSDYHIVATGGSIRQIAKEEDVGYERGLRPQWTWISGDHKISQKDFANLARELGRYREIFVATDADTEGEAIAWHVVDELAKTAGPHIWDSIKRVRLGEITPDAVSNAFATPTTLDGNLASAAVARSIADRIIAARLTTEVNRQPTSDEARQETEVLSLASPAAKTREHADREFQTGRVQAGVLRLLLEDMKARAQDLARGRVRVSAEVSLGSSVAKGFIVGADGHEYRIHETDPEAARRKLKTLVGQLPTTLEGYHHDGVDEVEHDLGAAPFLSTIEVMRRAIGHGILPWETMEALNNLYLGNIKKEEFAGPKGNAAANSPSRSSQATYSRSAPNHSAQNSAHPPIHLIDPDLTPTEFAMVYKANTVEAKIYEIVYTSHQVQTADPPILLESHLTLRRKGVAKEGHGGISFDGFEIVREGWLPDARSHAWPFIAESKNSSHTIRAFGLAQKSEVKFDLEDLANRPSGIDFLALLHLIEAEGIGRPSTYAATLKTLLAPEEAPKTAPVAFHKSTGRVELTPIGVTLASRIASRSNELGSLEFAREFDHKMTAVATGDIPVNEFLAWVLSLACEDLALRNSTTERLWTTLDDLRSGKMMNSDHTPRMGGFINATHATAIATASSGQG